MLINITVRIRIGILQITNTNIIRINILFMIINKNIHNMNTINSSKNNAKTNIITNTDIKTIMIRK